uniref:Uncharacterized protein n=1 Tax=Kalanchoe fedtschenkoi TaxID=63787 RepID=A0A7N0U6J7_KALFE
MEDLYTMSSGTIPPFGSWGYADELSYTHYFSCAAEAAAGFNFYSPYRAPGDLYAVDFSPCDDTPSKKKKVVGKEHRKQKVRKEYNNAGHHKQQQPQKPSLMRQPRTKKFDSERQGEAKCKPVDEDLYKIPPELIHAYKRKKMVGFFSRLLPTCIR